MSASKLIMVVDDDEALRESVCDVLDQEGYRTINATDGATALARLRKEPHKPALILLDLMMPGMNGWQFREQQLKDPALSEIPVVVMTASRELHGVKADEVVYKPVKLQRLLEVVAKYVAAAKAVEEKSSAPPIPADAVDLLEIFAGGGEMGARMRAFDWSASRLGPLSFWPPSLRSALSICLGSRFPIAIYWGPDLVLLYNDAWSPIPGSKHPAALGKPGLEVWPEIWTTIGPQFDQVMSTGRATFAEASHLPMHRHGYTEECYFDYTFTPIRGQSGRVEGIFNAVIETTFRVISERRTRILNELGEGLAGARSPEEAFARAASILAGDRHDVPFALLYALEGAEPRLAGIEGLSSDHPLARDPALLNAAKESGRVELVPVEDRYGPLPGGVWPEPATAILIAPITPVAGGEPSGFLLVGVSPRRVVDNDYRTFVERAALHVATVVQNAKAFLAERRRAEELAALDRSKTIFFSNVSHEFRTPLTLMLGPAQDLLGGFHGDLAGPQRQQLEVLHRNGLRLQKLVNALLDFSRLEAGRIDAAYEPVDLAALTRELASAFRSATERAGLELLSEVPALSEPIFVDPNMWEKIVLNLISNAFKFTFEGQIEVRLELVGENVALHVRDTGAGIPADELPRLFERFRRVEGVRARTHEGSGIGLALVLELAKLHGGSASVTSQLGAGSTFTVTIPRGSAHLPKERVRAPGSASPAGAKPFVEEALRWISSEPDRPAAPDAETTGNKPRARILLADDNSDMRDYIRRHLDAHYLVDSVSDGESAFQRALETQPSLILTDVMMPILDGFGLLQKLRGDARTQKIPVILLSARSGDEAKIEGLNAGADDYLIKPFSAKELLARIRTHLELGQLRGAAEHARDHLRLLFMQAPVAVSVLRAPDLVYDLANPRYLEMIGGREVTGKKFRDAFPELPDDAPVFQMISNVYQTGVAFSASEYRVPIDRTGRGPEDVYFQFTTQPIFDERGRVTDLITVAVDVTAQVLARQKIEESERRFRQLLGQVQAGIAETDLFGRLTLMNDRYKEIAGRSEAELKQLHLAELIHPADRARHTELFARLVERGDPFSIEERYVRPDGSIVWVKNSVSRVEDAAGQPYGTATLTIDVTQRRLLENELRDSEARYRRIFETAEVSIWEEDYSAVLAQVDALHAQHGPELRNYLSAHPEAVERAISAVHIRDVNAATLRMFGASHKEQLISSLHNIFLPETHTLFVESLVALAERKKFFAGESVLRTLSGKKLDIELAMSLPSGGDGSERVIVSIMDISSRKLVEREREAHVEEMERAVRFSEMFAGVLGHDLRNPLSAISTAAAVLAKAVDSEKLAKPISRISSSAVRMERMISQLLDFTRIRLGRGLPVERTAVDLAEVTRATAEELEPVFRRAIEVRTRGDVTGHWDRDRLGQLLSNVAANACQHSAENTPVQLDVDGGNTAFVCIRVRNQGVIAPELLSVIFEPLRQSEERPRQKLGSSGLGLGLYITQQIVLAHGGTVRVESDAEKGTLFEICLPRQAPEDRDRVFRVTPDE